MPRKRKAVRENQNPLFNKEITEAFMKRTELRNKFLKHKIVESRQASVKQRNYCISLLRKVKRNYYSNLNVKDITAIKKFWKTIKPLFLIKQNLLFLSPYKRIRNSWKSNEIADILNNYLYLCFKYQNSVTSIRSLWGCLVLH